MVRFFDKLQSPGDLGALEGGITPQAVSDCNTLLLWHGV